MQKKYFLIFYALTRLAHLNAMIQIESWADDDIITNYELFIQKLSKSKKETLDKKGIPFLHALFYAEMKDIQTHGTAAHSHGYLKRPFISRYYIDNFDIDVTNNDGTTLLMLMAAEKERYYNVHHGKRDLLCNCEINSLEFLTVTDLITRYKANPNIQDQQGLTALMHAIKNGNTIAAIELIKNSETNLDLHDKNGKTALMYALIKENNTVTELLLRQGAKINVYDRLKGSALIYALQKNNTVMSKYVLELGADLHSPSKVKPSHYARDNHDIKSLIEVFESYEECRNDEQHLIIFLQEHAKYTEWLFNLAALNDHQQTLKHLATTTDDMLAILRLCATWNKTGATGYALKKLIVWGKISPTLFEDKKSSDERSYCSTLFCLPCLCWTMSKRNPYENMLLKGLDATYKIRAPNTERPFEMVFEPTLYKKEFAEFFKTHNAQEKTPLIKI